MNAQILKELKHMKDQINDAIRRLDNLNAVQHEDNATQIADLQDLAINAEYDATLAELGL